VDYFIANSEYVSERIWKYYRRRSAVVYPPVDTSQGYLSPSHDDYYLSVGRLVESKRIDILIGACNRLGRNLLIAGAGRAEKSLKQIAGSTVRFLGRVPDQQLRELYARSRAFLFAADEDFGIVPVEAQSFGRPVIALGRGGSLETVIGHDNANPTGVYFRDQTEQSLVDAILRFESIEHSFRPDVIQAHSRQFDSSMFRTRMRELVDTAMRERDLSLYGGERRQVVFPAHARLAS
jgi:glycosyltransferase involved in cell wall biosynthesis